MTDTRAQPPGASLLETVRSARVWRSSELGLVVAILVAVVVFGALAPSFWSLGTAQSVLRGIAVIGLMVVGQTLLLVQREVDLSVGSTASLGAVVACKVTIDLALPWPTAFAVAVAVGATVGAVNAFLVLRLGLPSLIATLGTLFACSGLAFVVSDGQAVNSLPAELTEFAQATPFGAPVPVIIMLAIVVVGHVALTRTVFGASAYAIGGNLRAAVTAGVPTQRYKAYAFIVTSVLSSLAGLLLVSRLGVAEPGVGAGTEFAVVTAAVVGGVSLFGGAGTVFGAFLGAVFVQTISTGLITIGFESTLTRVATGCLLIVAVALDQLRRRRSPDH